MPPIKVLVHGASGRMGTEILSGLSQDKELELCGAVDIKAAEEYLSLPDGSGLIPFSSELGAILPRCRPEVLVDFSVASATMPAARLAARSGIHLVIGTTGLSDAERDELKELCRRHNIGAVQAPNFALGAVLLAHLARRVARHFDWAEVVEMHHETKIDSPSGTAKGLAEAMVEARGSPFHHNVPEKEPVAGSRGAQVGGVHIHAVRMPGRMAHHQVVLGTQGQTLTLSHDTINRECYLPGIILAVKYVVKNRGFTLGLEKVLGLDE